jgi:tetratricopeptide (TPR) repeat protein
VKVLPLADAVASLRSALADRYRLERELGRGGMATVYLARDLRHDRDVALKVLRPELAAVLGRERFLTEVRLTAKLDHPHILTLIDSGESDGSLWYVLPFVRGESLRQRLERERQLGLSEAVAIAGDIAGALEYAHQRGVIHRDVKPENILLHEGEAMLTDFGIALALREAGGERLTETGLSVGTLQYMSPEQATAERRLDARTDIYSLGAVVYEMLAGEPPFTGATGQALIAKLMTVPPTPLRTVRHGVPEHIDAAITRALAKVPADRFPTAAAFGASLRDAPTSGIGPMHPPADRRRLPLWTWFAVIGVLAGVVFWRIRARPAPPGPDPHLAALYRRARNSYDQRTAAGTIAAFKDFSAAVQRDSGYAAAWTGLAKTCVRAYNRNFSLPGISRDSVLHLEVVAAERALAADSGSADAWVAQAMVSRDIDPTELNPVFRALDRAIGLDSAFGPAWHQLAMTRAESGDFPGALKAWRRCVTVAPTYAEGIAFRALADYWRRQYDSAQVWADSAVALEPNYLQPRQVVGYVAIERGDFAKGAAAFDAARRLSGEVEVANALAGSALAEGRAGRIAEARAILRQADSLASAYSPTPLHTAVYLAQAYAGLGETDRAVAWLARYHPRGDLHFQLHLRCDPPFVPIAGDQRFRRLLILPRPPSEAGC